MNKKKKTYRNAYSLKSLIQVTGIVAVYADVDENDPDTVVYHSWPVDFIGLAKLTIKHYEDGKFIGNEDGGVVDVACSISEGWVQIDNEASNYCGIAKVGEDITQLGPPSALIGRPKRLLELPPGSVA